jgi:hypothetical protein
MDVGYLTSFSPWIGFQPTAEKQTWAATPENRVRLLKWYPKIHRKKCRPGDRYRNLKQKLFGGTVTRKLLTVTHFMSLGFYSFTRLFLLESFDHKFKLSVF